MTEKTRRRESITSVEAYLEFLNVMFAKSILWIPPNTCASCWWLGSTKVWNHKKIVIKNDLNFFTEISTSWMRFTMSRFLSLLLFRDGDFAVSKMVYRFGFEGYDYCCDVRSFGLVYWKIRSYVGNHHNPVLCQLDHYSCYIDCLAHNNSSLYVVLNTSRLQNICFHYLYEYFANDSFSYLVFDPVVVPWLVLPIENHAMVQRDF